MSNALTIIEAEFKPRLPMIADVLSSFRIPANAFQAGAMAYFQQNTYALENCTPQSVMNACVTFAVQGIHLDPGSQHACIVPFKKKAQPIVMVKGYTVLAARGGYTLQGRLVREGDKIREYGGSEPRIEHEPVLGNKGRIIGAYAVARSKQLPVLFSPFMTIDELLHARDTSKGYQSAKTNGNPHPWITHLEAMFVKTPKRLLAKDIPNDMLGAAAWLETQHDLGKVAYLNTEGKGVIEATAEEVFPQRQPEVDGGLGPKPCFKWVMANGEAVSFETPEAMASQVLRRVASTAPEAAAAALERNAVGLDLLRETHPDVAKQIGDALAAKARGQ